MVHHAVYHVTDEPPKKTRIIPALDFNQQSVVSPKGHGGRVSKLVSNGELMEYLFPDARTLLQAFQRGMRETKSKNCLGFRKVPADDAHPYHWISYEEAYSRSLNIASGIIDMGYQPGQSTIVGIFSINRPEWILTQLACYHYSMVPVPLYDTLGPESSKYLINKTAMEIVFTDSSKKALDLLKMRESCPSLKTVVVFENAFSFDLKEQLSMAGDSRLEVLTLEALENLGQSARDNVSLEPSKPEDLAIICFTSGTTGPPKGAMVTHANMIAALTINYLLKNVPIGADDTLLSFLPLAHMFEQLLEWCFFLLGGRVGYYSGDIKLLTEDLMTLKPTIFGVVPRLLNKIYDKSMQMANKNCFTSFMMKKAVKSKKQDLEKLIISTDSLWDRLIFKKIREKGLFMNHMIDYQPKTIFTVPSPSCDNRAYYIQPTTQNYCT